MKHDRWGVLKITGADPETFWIFFIDTTLPAGSFMETSGNLTETALRTELEKMGCEGAKMDSLIAWARENPI